MIKKLLLITVLSGLFFNTCYGQERVAIREWREDLRFLKASFEQKHIAPYRNVDKITFDSKFEEAYNYLNSVDGGTPDYYKMVGYVFEIVASIRDNHTTVYDRYDTFNLFPFLARWFQKNLYITTALKGEEEILGAKITHINGRQISEIYRSFMRVVPHSNELGYRDTMPYYMRNPELLRVFDIIGDLSAASFTLVLMDGSVIEHKFSAVSLKEYLKSKRVYAFSKDKTRPLFLQHVSKNYWFEYLPKQHLLYIRYKRASNGKGLKARDFWRRLFEFTDSNKIEKIVIDIRGNSGGQPDLALPLVAGIKSRKSLNQRGKLFTLIDGGTKSAGITLAAHLESHTNTLMVGEGIGDRPNHLSDARISKLPNSKIKIGIPILHYLNTHEHDDRWNIIPHIPVQYTFDHYQEGIDPYLKAIFPYEEVDNRNDGMLPQSLLGEYDFHVNQTLHLEHRDGQNYVRLSNGWETPLFQVGKGLYRTKLLDSFLKFRNTNLSLITSQSKEVPLPKKSTASPLIPIELIKRNDLTSAKAAYQKLHEEHGDLLTFQRNNLSFQALMIYYETNDFEKSKTLMDINLALHPGIGFVNISYGNLYQAYGQSFKSISWYIKGILKGYKD